MEMIYFIVIVILFFYLYSLSHRVKILEQKLKKSEAKPASAQWVSGREQSSPESIAEVHEGRAREPQASAAVPEVQQSVLPSSGLHLDLGQVSTNQWLTGIGVVALLFGMGFFLKYAINQGWISEWMRIILGLAVGTLLVTLGDLWTEKYKKYAHMLSGGGLAMLYFSIFAAYQFYHKLDQPVAFACMVVITILGVFLSYRYEERALAVLALIGGYLAPLLLNSGQNQQVALFGYITLLNVGVFAMLSKAFWLEVLAVALVGTGLNYGLWFASFSTRSNTLQSALFLVLNFVLASIATSMLFSKFHESAHLPKDADINTGVLQLLFSGSVFLGITTLLYNNYHDYLSVTMLLCGILTFLSYALVDRLDYQRLNYPFSFSGAFFLLAACAWQFSGTTLDLYLLLLSVIGLSVGFLVKRADIRTWALVALVFASFKTLFESYAGAVAVPIMNAKFLVECSAVIALVFTDWMYGRYALTEEDKQVSQLTKLFAAAILWVAVSAEILHNLPGATAQNARNLGLSVWWMAYAVLLAVIGGFHGKAILRKAAATLFGVTILKVFLYDVQTLDLGYRVVSFIALGVILLVVSFVYQKNKDTLQKFLKGDESLAKLE